MYLHRPPAEAPLDPNQVQMSAGSIGPDGVSMVAGPLPQQQNYMGPAYTPRAGMMGTRRFLSPMQKIDSQPGGPTAGMSGQALQQYANRGISGGVNPGHFYGPNAVEAARMSDAQRMAKGAAMGPQNAALSGYLMGH